MNPLDWTPRQLRLVCAFLTFWLTALVPPAFAATSTTVTPDGWDLYKGTRILEREKPTQQACVDAAPAHGAGSYTCRTQTGVVVTVVTDPPVPPPPPPPPPSSASVFFTDLTRGPPGTPITICGKSINAVSIGGIDTKIIAHQAMNGALDCARVIPVSSGAITVNGSATAFSYTISVGNVLYVSTSGNDSTAAKNDPTKPWRKLQGSTERSGALGAYSPGDVIVLREGNYSDVGVGGRWARFLTQGNVTITSYAGEKVVYSGNPGGGIQGPDSVHAGQAPNVTISSITIVGASNSKSDGCPINLQYGADSWRIVNVDLSWPVAPGGMKCAGIAGHGANVSILGAYIHDIAGGNENHGIYLDGGDGKNGPYEIGWTSVTRVTGGNLLQTYDAWSNGVRGFNVHDSSFTSGGRYGLNLSDGTVSGSVTNNLIQDTALSGIRMNFISEADTVITINGNTLRNVNTQGASSSQGAINCDSTVKLGTVRVWANQITRGKGATEDYSEYGSCPAVKLQ